MSLLEIFTSKSILSIKLDKFFTFNAFGDFDSITNLLMSSLIN